MDSFPEGVQIWTSPGCSDNYMSGICSTEGSQMPGKKESKAMLNVEVHLQELEALLVVSVEVVCSHSQPRLSVPF